MQLGTWASEPLLLDSMQKQLSSQKEYEIVDSGAKCE